MKDWIKNISGNTVGFIFAMIFLVALGISWYQNGTNLKKYGTCTVGIIHHWGGTSYGHKVYYYFEVNGKKYESYSPVSSKWKSLVFPGMRFAVKYQSNDPSNSTIFLNVPIDHYNVSKECCDTLTDVL